MDPSYFSAIWPACYCMQYRNLACLLLRYRIYCSIAVYCYYRLLYCCTKLLHCSIAIWPACYCNIGSLSRLKKQVFSWHMIYAWTRPVFDRFVLFIQCFLVWLRRLFGCYRRENHVPWEVQYIHPAELVACLYFVGGTEIGKGDRNFRYRPTVLLIKPYPPACCCGTKVRQMHCLPGSVTPLSFL